MTIKSIFNKIYFMCISANKRAEILDVKFGKNCKFNKSMNFGTEPYLITIGDDFYASGNIQFITHDGSVNVIRNLYDEYKNIDLFKPIFIGNNVFLGHGVTLLPGVDIGDNVIIGAGSIVKGKLKNNSIYAGIPVRYICSIDEYLKKNKSNFMYTKTLKPIEKKDVIKKKWEGLNE